MSGLVFGAPAMLSALILLPVIWWLLRLTPPRPVMEWFPPLRILADVERKEETPDKSPWWLTALRLLLAACVIVALARPQLRPQESRIADADVLAMLIDNSWATVDDWADRVTVAESLINEVADRDIPVALAFAASPPNAAAGPFSASEALDRLAAGRPEPVPSDRDNTLARLADAVEPFGTVSLALLTDGLAGTVNPLGPGTLGEKLTQVLRIERDGAGHLALTGTRNDPSGLIVTLSRNAAGPGSGVILAQDSLGREIGTASFAFDALSRKAEAVIDLPLELRNDIATLSVSGRQDAASIRMMDDSSRRRRVALISGSAADDAQPLLAPLYYIERALKPVADTIRFDTETIGTAIADAINQRTSVIVLADIGVIPEDAGRALEDWLANGGMLIRFAGPRLAAAVEGDDTLLPVRLRLGERALGGALSWSEPQPIAPYPAIGPFAALTPPREVTVSRQVLAEPDIDLPEHTWASLADGTPLVTGAGRGRGTLALFHIAPDATWSNLPITGSFVDMLTALVRLSGNAGAIAAAQGETVAILPPLKVLDAKGSLVPPAANAEPVAANEPLITYNHPPGLYGTADAFVARNLFSGSADFAPLTLSDDWPSATRIALSTTGPQDLRPHALALAVLLLVVDGVAMLVLGGALNRLARRRVLASLLLVAGLAATGLPEPAQAQQSGAEPSVIDEKTVIDAISETRLAYVVTGDRTVDAITLAGLRGLTMFLASRTALEPGRPVGIDLARDELALFPIIYWPITPNADLPDAATMARVDAYMRNGGTILFDTRDRLTSGFGQNAVSPEALRLREIVGTLNIPPLEPVPADHVLTKSFFILDDFPGRYAGGPLWVAAAATDGDGGRPVRQGDGVTPIIITGNDLAAAWAVDDAGNPLLPTVPNDPVQRLHAFRVGTNIMMYMLTGNYKADQVHIPALLERLGQ